MTRVALICVLVTAVMAWPVPAACAAAGAASCQPRPLEKQWLEQQLKRWRPQLMREPGYQPPATFAVCALHARRPYADVRHERIHVGPLRSSNEAVSLVHEYLHLALAGHPHGRNEEYVEALAQRLVRNGGH